MDDISPPIHDPPPGAPGRPRYRVPVGLPRRDEGRAAGAVVSLVIHALIIGLLIIPFFLPSSVIARMQQGAGGAGPAGGGGGGNKGSGGTIETLHFVKVSTQAVPTPTSLPPVPDRVAPPVPKAEPPKPVVTPPPTAPPAPGAKAAAPAASAPASAPGTGGGTGADGSAGAGPGSGGGVGAGTGTGKGGLTGPGTGGGTQANYSPQPIALFLPPLPAPGSVRGFRFTAEFDVDSTGRVLDFKFTPTPDGGYNRQLASLLRTIRFKPGTRPDGSPTRMKAQLGFDF